MSELMPKVRAFLRKLPTVRKELVAAAGAGVSAIGTAVATLPHLSAEHLATLGGVTGFLTLVIAILTNNKVEEAIDEVAKDA